MKRSLSLLLVASAMASPAMGWVTRAESVRNVARLAYTALKAGDDPDEIDAYRESLERRYSSYGDYESPSDFFEDDHVSRLRDEEHSPFMESSGDWSDDSVNPCGDDCEECEIPDEFRLTNVDPIDVMAYLQIRRAEPLRVVSKRQVLDWE